MKNAMILSDLNYTELTTEELNTINGGRSLYMRQWDPPKLNSSFYKTKDIVSGAWQGFSKSGGVQALKNAIELVKPFL
ncbi:hypothetical protein JCM17380_43020 [Desulfosporosinus burensis]